MDTSSFYTSKAASWSDQEAMQNQPQKADEDMPVVFHFIYL